jgi:hypothetical protein
MSKVVLDVSMSPDGFIRATGYTREEGLGKGGEVLHEWAMGGDPGGSDSINAGVSETGAVITGGGTTSIRSSTGAQRADSLRPSADLRRDPQGPGARRQEAADGKNVALMGSDTASQFLRAGLLDHISVHVVPVLFGEGLQLLEYIGDEHIRLEKVRAVDTQGATHIFYNVLK